MLGKPDPAVLGSGVVGATEERHPAPGKGIDVDDPPAVLFHHHRDDGLTAQEDALEVDLQHAIPLLVGDVLEQRGC